MNFDRASLSPLLLDGIAALGLELPAGAAERLLDYLEMLAKWNRVYNLTAVRDPREMVSKHLLDSLAVVPFMRGPRLADVGTGAGLPGIPLALALPAWHFTLVDSNAKKTRFVQQVVGQLRLPNVSVVSGRVEAVAAGEPFDMVTSRAFSSLREMVEMSCALVAPGGMIAALKGLHPDEEIAALPDDWKVVASHALRVPGLEAERHLILLARGADGAARA